MDFVLSNYFKKDEWSFDLIPYVNFFHRKFDDEVYVLKIGWLFWAVNIVVGKWN